MSIMNDDKDVVIANDLLVLELDAIIFSQSACSTPVS